MAERKLLLASHGRLAQGLKETAEFFLGRSDSILAICAYLDSSDAYLKEIRSFIDDAKEGEAVIFSDILGGSVNQQVMMMVEESGKQIPIVTSMNLPIVLSAALSGEPLTQEHLQALCGDCDPTVMQWEEDTKEEGDLDAFLE